MCIIIFVFSLPHVLYPGSDEHLLCVTSDRFSRLGAPIDLSIFSVSFAEDIIRVVLPTFAFCFMLIMSYNRD